MRISSILLLLLPLLFPTLVLAQQPDADATPFLSVSIDFDRLEESTQSLNAAISGLAVRLQSLAADDDNLSPEQIQSLGELVTEINQLLDSLQQTINGFAPAIESIREPANELLQDLLVMSREQVLDPFNAQMQSTVQSWILLSGLVMLLLLIVTGSALFFSVRQLREITTTLKSISNDYELVPKRWAVPADGADNQQ
jgi:methyl-accepting chemotaxis protein